MNHLRIYILTDLEGVAGISELRINSRRRTISLTEYEKLSRAKKLLTAETNAAIEGILEVDNNAEIVVNDSHGYGDSIYPELLNPAAHLIMGSRRKNAIPYLDQSFNALMLIGAHSKANSKGCMNHSFSSHVKKILLNNTEVGEIGLYVYMAGEMGVPTIFVSGDDITIAEANSYVPNIKFVETKKSISIFSAKSISPAASCSGIREKTKQAVRNISAFPLPVIEPPYNLKVIYKKPFVSILRALKYRRFGDCVRSTIYSTSYKGKKLNKIVSNYLS